MTLEEPALVKSVCIPTTNYPEARAQDYVVWSCLADTGNVTYPRELCKVIEDAYQNKEDTISLDHPSWNLTGYMINFHTMQQLHAYRGVPSSTFSFLDSSLNLTELIHSAGSRPVKRTEKDETMVSSHLARSTTPTAYGFGSGVGSGSFISSGFGSGRGSFVSTGGSQLYDSAPATKDGKWEYRGDSGWTPYPDSEQPLIEKSYQTDPNTPHTLSCIENYVIDFNVMRQRNTITHRARVVRRV